MLDKFDSDGEEPNPALNDVDHIAHKYYTKSKSPHITLYPHFLFLLLPSHPTPALYQNFTEIV